MEINRTQDYLVQNPTKTQTVSAESSKKKATSQMEKRNQERETTLERLKEYQEKTAINQIEANRLLGITSRLNTGKRLSGAELAYLRQNSPELYAKALKIEKVRKAMRQKLRLCKTKGQVLALRSDVTQTAIIPNNNTSSVPSSNNMTTQTGVNAYYYHATNHEWNQFKNSKRFLKLPYYTKNKLIQINKKI